MQHSIIDSFQKLKSYCEAENYQGWDPYDGLNSKLFQATPLKNWSFARLVWIQLFKRNPINLRKLLRVPKGYNAKGVGLFLTGYCNLYEIAQNGNHTFGKPEEILEKIRFLADLLIKIKSPDYTHTCWGYNFDWQNRVFYQPKNTPTVVATSFCGESLFRAFEVTKNKEYLKAAYSSCQFVAEDLNRTHLEEDTFIFSYSPLDHSQVYNASLLGAKLLAIGYSYSGNEDWKGWSQKAIQAIISKQASDGSWIYGEAKIQDWIDNFHTGFNLECIWKVMQNLGDFSFQDSFEKGIDYYLETFFLEGGLPKYYHDKTYPIDIHSPAQLMAVLSTAHLLKKNKTLADRVFNWTLSHMQSDKGYFYYQLKQGISSKIPYIRWSQAWMFYAFSEYFKSFNHENLD